MMNFKKSGTLLRCLEYLAVFLGFFLMYLFVVPQSDVFLFLQETDSSVSSILEYSLFFGNGRLLGNIIGAYLSHHFAFAGLIISLGLSIIVILLNHIIWDGLAFTVFPLALLVAFPSPEMLGECYYLLATFCNYVIPVVLFLISIWNLKSVIYNPLLDSQRQHILLFISLLCAVCSCLFSENTTIVVIVSSVLFVVYWYLHTKMLSTYLLLHMVAVLTGALIMFLLPIVTNTSSKMHNYRHIASTPADILKQCVSAFLNFSNIFNHMYPIIFLLSISMLLLCLKQKKFQSSLKKMQLAFFAIYPFVSVGLSMIDSNSLIAITELCHTADAVLVILFVINILMTIMLTEDQSMRLTLCFFSAVVIASVAPMMIVNQSGCRTYYTTFICVMTMALWLLRQHIAEYFQNAEKKAALHRCISTTAASCFLILTLVLFLQSVCNYDFYIIRSNYIAAKITSNEDYYVPYMPYDTISAEDSWTNIISFAFPSSVDSKQITVHLSEWEGFEHYKKNFLLNPIHAFSFAIQNWEYKNPLYPDSLCN